MTAFTPAFRAYIDWIMSDPERRSRLQAALNAPAPDELTSQQAVGIQTKESYDRTSKTTHLNRLGQKDGQPARG